MEFNFDAGKSNRELAAMLVKHLNKVFEGVAMNDKEIIDAIVAAEALEARLEGAEAA